MLSNMISIAICDDEQMLLEELKRNLNVFFENTAVKISTFLSADDLISEVMENGAFDIYILDVMMPKTNGIELGTKLRQMGDNGVIIYLTSAAEYAVLSYEVGAFFYLLKPVDNDKLTCVLNRAVRIIEDRKNKGIAVKTHDGVKFLRFDEIMYAELKDRVVCYTTSGGEKVISQYLRVPFREACAKLLGDSRFVMCGASFCVNLGFIKALEKNYIVLKNDAKLSMPQKVIYNIKPLWLDFWLEERK